MAGKGRSPSYPSLHLGEAIEKAEKLYRKEGRAKVPAEVAVGAWGYNGINGASARVLAALRQYGLVDDADGNVSVSDRAITILLEPNDSRDRGEAILSAAREPQVFAAIQDEFPGGLPSERGLVAFLVRKLGFTEDGAQKVNAVLRDTLALASDYRARHVVEAPIDDAEDAPKAVGSPPLSAPSSPRSAPEPTGGGSPMLEWKLPLFGGNVAAFSFLRQPTLGDIGVLKAYLGVVELQLKDHASSPSGAADDKASGAEGNGEERDART